MANKVIVFGIDGMEPKLVERWKDELPNIKKIIEQGSSGFHQSTLPPATVTAWASFYTGKNLGKLGVYQYRKRAAGEYKADYLNRTDIKSEAIWDILKRYGKKVIAVNMPFTFPPPRADGIIIPGILTPLNIKNYAYPKEILRELDDVTGGYVGGGMMEAFPSKNIVEHIDLFVSYLCNVIEKRTKAMIHLLHKYPWDFAMVVYMATDSISHYDFFHIDEPVNCVKAIYIAIDKAIGEILNSIKDTEQLYTIIMSDHGFRKITHTFETNYWLYQNGYLALTSVKNLKIAITDNLIPFFEKIGLVRVIQRYVSRSTISRFIALTNDIFATDSVDWSKTKAYDFGEGAIYLNVKNREPEGIVSFGSEYTILRDEIINKLKQVKILDSGKSLISRMATKEELWHGPYIDKAPDIMFGMEESEYTASARVSDRLFDKAVDWQGSHNLYGFVAIAGPGIIKRTLRCHIQDFLPTISFLLNLPLSKDLDGRIIDCFEDSIEAKYLEEEKPKKFEEKHYSKEERIQIERELKKLGYF